MLAKNIFVVHSDYSLFIKTIQRKNKKSEIIDPHFIKKRISSENDECPQEIINFNIIKRINSFKCCKISSFIYFYATNLDVKLIESLQSLFSHSQYTTYLHLLIEEALLQDLSDDLKSKFHSIQSISK